MNPYLRAGALACVLALPSGAWAQESPAVPPAGPPAAAPATPPPPAATAAAVPPAEPSPAPRRYTGHVLSIENLFGLHEMEETEESRSGQSRSKTYSSTGFASLLAPRLGYQYATQSGLIGGFLVGMQRLHLTQEVSPSRREPDDGTNVTLVELRPRIGYGVLQPGVGGWVRVGPNAMYVRASGETSYAISAGFDAGLVVSPIPRVGILFGMGVDLALTGKSIPEEGANRSYSMATRSFTLGLVTVL